MEYRRAGSRIVARIDRGEELTAKLREIAEREDIRFAAVTGWGTSRDMSLSYYDTKEGCEYGNVFERIDLELTSVSGMISRTDGETRMELRAVIGNPSYDRPMHTAVSRFGFAVGGRLRYAVISTTCTLVIELIDLDAHMARSDELGCDVLEFDS